MKETIYLGPNAKDIKGQRFGKSVAIRPVGHSKNQSIEWEFLCDCGSFFERSYAEIRLSISLGHTTTGCRPCTRKQIGQLISKPSGQASRNEVIGTYKRRAAKGGREFRLNEKTLDALFISNCHYCGSPPSNRQTDIQNNGDFIYQGIDRIDNDIDYVPFNCIPCCNICNKAKRNMDYLDFVSWIKRSSKNLEGMYA
ncbi:MAG: hypothetical protein AAB922_03355 [Patescibacteria group bacterium]